MKTILLLRHAKSDWSDPTLADFDRPLAKRGLKDAPLMGDVLDQFEHGPDMILSSPAKRARETAELVAESCGYTRPIQWEEPFYGGDSHDLITALQHLPATIERPLLVGHNPTMEETAADLLTLPEGECNGTLALRMPTAALVCIAADIEDWTDLRPGDCILRWFLIPKLVKAIW